MTAFFDIQEESSPAQAACWKTVLVHFTDKASADAFSALVKQDLNLCGNCIWYPRRAEAVEPRMEKVDGERKAGPRIINPPGSAAKAVDASGVEGFFDITDEADVWKREWVGMPDFVQDDCQPWKSVLVCFTCASDMEEFARKVGQDITPNSTFIWYPKVTVSNPTEQRYVNATGIGANPRYPIYIISKGRWSDGTRLTSRTLERMHVPYHIVIEPQEYDQYAAVIDPAKILVLPFSNLGQGSIPARNWVWEHSISVGAKRHWILDDNIRHFYRLNCNNKMLAGDGTIFYAAEDFVDRYENVAIAGFQYEKFAPRKVKQPAFCANTRIYSCILIKNNLPYRWRGRYNEDTDLSLRALKDGWCTVLFYAFLAGKQATMTLKGGNMDELYKGDGRLQMAESLREQHPDVTKVVWKWGRWQHSVDYSGFKENKLVRRPDVQVPEGVNNYGMKFQRKVGGSWVDADDTVLTGHYA